MTKFKSIVYTWGCFFLICLVMLWVTLDFRIEVKQGPSKENQTLEDSTTKTTKRIGSVEYVFLIFIFNCIRFFYPDVFFCFIVHSLGLMLTRRLLKPRIPRSEVKIISSNIYFHQKFVDDSGISVSHIYDDKNLQMVVKTILSFSPPNVTLQIGPVYNLYEQLDGCSIWNRICYPLGAPDITHQFFAGFSLPSL